jgi:inhibitor of KinA sporulation pathway (predicted exonuclease)
MQQKGKYLSILFCVTSGLSGEHLGSDEHEIVNVCSLLVDVKQLKTLDIFNAYIRPHVGPATASETQAFTNIYSRVDDGFTYSTLESFLIEVIDFF